MPTAQSHVDPMTEVLADCCRQETTDFGHAWIGMEPTFQSRKSVQKWNKMSAEPGGEDAYFEDDYMLRTQKKVVRKIRKRYEEQRDKGQAHCIFARVELDDDLDQWQVRRQNLLFHWPNPDDRAFRATRPRAAAFEKILMDYWAGRFHPRANGLLTAENALLDRGFGPACAAADGLMDLSFGPAGDPREVFQTNFAFGRTVRWNAQNIHPGYWQSAHPDEDGYRSDQIMRYSEGNLSAGCAR